MEGSHPALPAEPGTLKATLPDTPGIIMRMVLSYGKCWVVFISLVTTLSVAHTMCRRMMERLNSVA
jgi:hypothetical protein